MPKKSKNESKPPFTKADKEAWAEHERTTRKILEDRLRATHGDEWMEANREELDKDWERSKDLIL